MTRYICDTTAENVWKRTYELVTVTGQEQEGRDQETLEVIHMLMELTEPSQRFVYSRPINLAFALAEVIWILNGKHRLEELSFWNPRMKNYSDDGLSMHGAYGYRLRKHFENDQLQYAYNSLKHNPNGRQVVLQIWDADQDLSDGDPHSKDIPCNIMSHLMIRNSKLEWLQVMRSNDLIWGTPYNLIQWTMLQEIMAGWLDVKVGSYVHLSDSLHIYKRHWDADDTIVKELETVAPINTDHFTEDYEESNRLWKRLDNVAILLRKEEFNKYGVVPSDIKTYLDTFPESYRNIVIILLAELLHKGGERESVLELLNTCTNPAYRYLQTQWMQRETKQTVEKQI